MRKIKNNSKSGWSLGVNYIMLTIVLFSIISSCTLIHSSRDNQNAMTDGSAPSEPPRASYSNIVKNEWDEPINVSSAANFNYQGYESFDLDIVNTQPARFQAVGKVIVENSFQQHSKYFNLSSISSLTYTKLYKGSLSYSTIEFWDYRCRYNSVQYNMLMDWGSNHYIRVSAGNVVYYNGTANVNVLKYDGSAATIPQLNQWNHIRFEFNLTHLNYYLNNTFSGAVVKSSTKTPNSFGFWNYINSAYLQDFILVDAIDIDSAPGYITNRNQQVNSSTDLWNWNTFPQWNSGYYQASAFGNSIKVSSSFSSQMTSVTAFSSDYTNVTQNNHHNVSKLISGVSGGRVYYSRNEFTSLNYECYAEAAQTNLECWIITATSGAWSDFAFGVGFKSNGKIEVITSKAGLVSDSISYSANQMYHFRIEYIKNSSFKLYVDSILVYSDASFYPNSSPTRIYYSAAASSTYYIDAISLSSDSDYFTNINTLENTTTSKLTVNSTSLFVSAYQTRALTQTDTVEYIHQISDLQNNVLDYAFTSSLQNSIIFTEPRKNVKLYSEKLVTFQFTGTSIYSVNVVGQKDVWIPIGNYILTVSQGGILKQTQNANITSIMSTSEFVYPLRTIELISSSDRPTTWIFTDSMLSQDPTNTLLYNFGMDDFYLRNGSNSYFDLFGSGMSVLQLSPVRESTPDYCYGSSQTAGFVSDQISSRYYTYLQLPTLADYNGLFGGSLNFFNQNYMKKAIFYYTMPGSTGTASNIKTYETTSFSSSSITWNTKPALGSEIATNSLYETDVYKYGMLDTSKSYVALAALTSGTVSHSFYHQNPLYTNCHFYDDQFVNDSSLLMMQDITTNTFCAAVNQNGFLNQSDIISMTFKANFTDSVYMSFYDENSLQYSIEITKYSDLADPGNYPTLHTISSYTTRDFVMPQDISFDRIEVSTKGAAIGASSFLQFEMTSLKLSRPQFVEYVAPYSDKIVNFNTSLVYIFEDGIQSDLKSICPTTRTIIYDPADRSCIITIFDQQNNVIDFETFQVNVTRTANNYTMSGRLLSNRFDADRNTFVYIYVYDRFGYSITNRTMLANEFLDIQITLYSLKIYNQQENFVYSCVELDPNFYPSSTLNWSEWLAPSEIVKYRLRADHYRIGINNSNSITYYSYTLAGDDVLLIQSVNTIANVLQNIQNVNSTIGNQITSVQINLTNQNSAINNSIINLEINIGNFNSSLGNLLLYTQMNLTAIGNNISSFYVYTQNQFVSMQNIINSSFIELNQSVFLINNSIYTSVNALSMDLENINNTVMGNLSWMIQFSPELTAILTNCLFAENITWYSDIESVRTQTMEYNIINKFRNESAMVQIRNGNLIKNLSIANTPLNELMLNYSRFPMEYRVISQTSGNELVEWTNITDKTIDFGFWQDVIPEIPVDIIQTETNDWILTVVIIGSISVASIIGVYYVAKKSKSNRDRPVHRKYSRDESGIF